MNVQATKTVDFSQLPEICGGNFAKLLSVFGFDQEKFDDLGFACNPSEDVRGTEITVTRPYHRQEDTVVIQLPKAEPPLYLLESPA